MWIQKENLIINLDRCTEISIQNDKLTIIFYVCRDAKFFYFENEKDLNNAVETIKNGIIRQNNLIIL